MTRKVFTLSDELLKVIQDLADEKYDGNASMALRAILKAYKKP